MNPVAEELVRRATAAGLRLAVAESCTGGEVTAALSAVPGASRCLWGGAVVYTAEAKQRLAGLSAELLERYGTVSEQTSAALARAMRERAGADIALAVTGWAGPDGEQVGSVYLAVEGPGGGRCVKLTIPGSRTAVRAAATRALLEMGLEAVRDAEARA